MRQVLQSLKTGDINLVDVPAPQLGKNQILIETKTSLISTGTERMLLEFGQSNTLEKALSQPDKVKQVLAKIRVDGLAQTFDSVNSKLNQPITLGYCNAGIIRGVGSKVDNFAIGDRVVSDGSHAEIVVTGRNLVAKIPENVTFEEACFAPLGAIALQSLRLATPTLGETFVVIGLGLVGLLTAQLLQANGCRVIGIDFLQSRIDLLEKKGIEGINVSGGQDAVQTVLAMTKGIGADGVIVAASSKASTPMTQAAEMSRKKGRVVMVGVTGMNLSRPEYFAKELSCYVSSSFGPGRYDSSYESQGIDYPIGFVRWTQQRNFEACLEMMRADKLEVLPYVSQVIDIGDVKKAYEQITDKKSDVLGIILSYSDNAGTKMDRTIRISPNKSTDINDNANVALIGVGGFGSRITVPALKKAGAVLKTAVSRGGVSAFLEGGKGGFETASTDVSSSILSKAVNTVIIATRHDSHASLSLQALKAGKHVFVEKPLGLTLDDIDQIESAIKKLKVKPKLMIGFNRRFAPLSIKMKDMLDSVSEPKSLIAIINAGELPASHWAHDPIQGGGRVIGEGCHFVDLMRYFVGHPISGVTATQVKFPTANGIKNDKVTITLTFEDGSVATVHYFANGPKTLVKERYEAFVGDKSIELVNFQRLNSEGWTKNVSIKESQNKGHAAAIKEFIDAVKYDLPCPIPIDEIFEVSRWTIKAAHDV